jgi:hypothetical protein
MLIIRINADTSPSRFHDGQQVVCIETHTLAGEDITKGQIYIVAHACQHGPALVLEGKPKRCWRDAWFSEVELLSDEALAKLAEGILEPITA